MIELVKLRETMRVTIGLALAALVMASAAAAQDRPDFSGPAFDVLTVQGRSMSAAVQLGNVSPDARELERIEQQLAAAWKAGDCAGWGALLAPEWSVTHVTAAILTKAEALAMCKAPRQTQEDHRIDDLSVRVFGDSAIVTGRNTVSTGGTAPTTLRLRFTDVFVRRDGRWQAVATHATRLTP